MWDLPIWARKPKTENGDRKYIVLTAWAIHYQVNSFREHLGRGLQKCLANWGPTELFSTQGQTLLTVVDLYESNCMDLNIV